MSENEHEHRPASDEDQPGRVILIASAVVGGVWIATAVLAGFHYFGIDYIASLPPVTLAMVGAAAVLPALMVFLAGAAAREGIRARYEARRLADAASDLINPSARAEMSARRLAVAVRGEITALDRALEQTIAKLHDVEASVTRQTHAVNSIAAQARTGAESMITGLGHERAELLQIAEDLNNQAAMIGQHISRHTQAIAESARIAEAEVRAADEVLGSRITSFGAAAALISDRTHALTGAAAASADSALRLETALSQALDTLGKAASLTEAARQSAESATIAASSTANAIHDSTARAIDDARRAAEMIRGEAASVERDAESAMSRLRDAAESARGVARQALSAVDKVAPTAPPPKQAPAIAKAAFAPEFKAPPTEPKRAPQPPAPAPKLPDPAAARAASMGSFSRGPAEPKAPATPPSATPPTREAPRPQPVRSEAEFRERLDDTGPGAGSAGNGGAWTWRELLSSIDEGGDSAKPPAGPGAPAPHNGGRMPPARRSEPAEDAIARLTQAVTEPRGAHPLEAVAVIERAGVQMSEVFTVAALDRIAHRSRNGSQARRKAVKDAVGPAVTRLRDHLRKDDRARQEAAGFLGTEGARIAELLARGRASMSADATRAFLLLDAAEG